MMLRRLLSPAALPGRRGLFVLAAAAVACAALAGFAAPAQAQTETAATSTNTAPAFVAGLPSEQSVAENTAPGTAIGSPYTATDADADDTLIWSLEGPDAASFAIDTSTGQLKTKASLDFETKSSYVVTLKVSDGTASAKIVVRITVTAMNARTVRGRSRVCAPTSWDFHSGKDLSGSIGTPLRATVGLQSPATKS